MFRIILALVATSLLSAGQAFAVPDAVLFDGGDVRINDTGGIGNGLVFPDGSKQTTAAGGVTKVVHGTIAGSTIPSIGTVIGTGFNVARTTSNSIGTYNITFSPSFTTVPDCVVTPRNNSRTPFNAYIGCEVTSVSTTAANVECHSYINNFDFVDATFTFICVK